MTRSQQTKTGAAKRTAAARGAAATRGIAAARGARLADSQARSAHIAELLKALAHPLRIRIVAILCQGDVHVSALAEQLEVKQAIVSQQLQILRTHRLVASTRENGFAVYGLAEPQLRNLVCCMESCTVQ